MQIYDHLSGSIKELVEMKWILRRENNQKPIVMETWSASVSVLNPVFEIERYV